MSALKAAAEGIYIALSVSCPERLENTGFFSALFFDAEENMDGVAYLTAPSMFRFEIGGQLAISIEVPTAV